MTKPPEFAAVKQSDEMSAGVHEADFESLARDFVSPPNSAKPRVWWHWMNGNITLEGIERDLQWMTRIGVGGLQNFDGALETPQVVPRRLGYMSPPWQDAFRYATKRAHELGLEFAIASSPGWSETGGPWVKTEDGMKKLVWSETVIEGGEAFAGALTAPPSVAGPFQDIPMVDMLTLKEVEGPRLYRDVAVVAYRKPPALTKDPIPIAARTSVPSINAQAWLDAGPSRPPLKLSMTEGQPTWLLYDYGCAYRLRALSLTRHVPLSFRSSVRFIIEVSMDGECFEHLTALDGGWNVPHITVSFSPVTARYLRLTIEAVPPTPWQGFEFEANAPGAISVIYTREVTEILLREFKVYAAARLHRFEEKAGFSIAPAYGGLEGPPSEPDEVINPEEVIDISEKAGPDGTLNWSPPPGRWTVLRVGYSLTGKTNHPASVEATGLEVDKLDRQAVKGYLDHYLATFERTVGKDWIGQKGIRAFLTDSIESAGQNWTRRMLEEFKARRGYDLTRWLPAFTGVILGDTTRTERFWWDFRRTLIELIAESHYGQIAESVHAREMLYYSESLEGYPTATLGDDLDMRIPADIPMAALWTSYRLDEKEGIPNHIIDMIGAASVAHVCGKTLVGCEAMTSSNEPWAFSPQSLKPCMDLAFVLGINRPIIHASVHQPVEKKPGLSLGCFGQHFTRHETWAEMAGPWMSYLSRTSHLLQQGRFVADIAWYYGEEGSAANLVPTMTLADFPARYGFDLISPNMLLKYLWASDRQLVSAAGARYRLLYLGGSGERMTLSVLRKLKAMADAGVAIAGWRPTGSPSLSDEGREEDYERLVTELWDGGKVVESRDPEAVLHSMNVAPDFKYTSSQPCSHVRFLHRQLPDGEIYFLSNRRRQQDRITASFRTTGQKPELWHADIGAREEVSWRAEDGRTHVSLDLQPYQSAFVIFRERTDRTEELVLPCTETKFLSLEGPWELSFETDRGAPTEPVSDRLGSWAHSNVPGVKYFSGIGTYRTQVSVPGLDLKSGERLILDLGEVHELAEVTVNGTPAVIAWHAPYRVDVTDAIKPGINTIQVRIANLWVNRLIGDKQPGATAVAFTVTPTYAADAPLRPSGLVGPVALLRRRIGTPACLTTI